MRGIIHSAVVAAVVLVASPASASINFGNPYVFASQEEAEKGISLPLYGGSEREVSYVSVRVYRWVQKDGDPYALEPAPEVAVFPQMVRLEPQARASVRLAWARSAPVDERYYRLVLEEFDRPDEGSADKDKAVLGFRVRPRASLPMVIFGRDNLEPAQLSATLTTVSKTVEQPVAEGEKAKAGPKAVEERVVRVSNSGQTYGRVAGFRDADGTVHNAMIYVLPGSTLDVPLPAAAEKGLELLYSSGRAEHVRKEKDALRSVAVN